MEPSEELREGVARVILDEMEGSVFDHDYGRQMRQWEFAKRLARAAISAMQAEPIPVYKLPDATDEFVKKG